MTAAAEQAAPALGGEREPARPRTPTPAPAAPDAKPKDEEAAQPAAGGDAARDWRPQWLRSPSVVLILIYYGLCSSTLIVINKVTVHVMRAPVAILLSQFAFTGLGVRLLTAAGVLQTEGLRWELVRPFMIVAASVLGTIFSNMKVLEYTNVETFITFRSSTPLVLCWLDWMFLNRELPDRKGVGLLVLMVTSCCGYTYFDQGFRLQAYTWLAIWYFFFVTDAAWIKYTCDTIEMTNFGRVYYTNTLCALALGAAFPLMTDEHAVLSAPGALSAPRIALLLLSCVVGLCMSHASFLLRSTVSATAATVVGVVCKLGSVLLNLLIWDEHATPIQLFFLSLGLAGGSLYRQAPLRAQPAAAAAASSAAGGEAVQAKQLPLAAQDMHAAAKQEAADAQK